MKNQKKPKGTKARVQAHKKRIAYIGHVIVIGFLVVVICISGFLLYSTLNPHSEHALITPTSQFEPENLVSQLKAAIIDHLSLSYPNETFVQTATEILRQAGYSVHYYAGEQVTVEFYRSLPTHSYDLLVLRVHSGTLTHGTNRIVNLFSSEPYSKTKYVYEQLTDQVGKAQLLRGETWYFGISQNFVTSSMRGTFKNTTIIMMGCEGLINTDMAEAFVERGARVYISWDGSVLSSHTDLATIHLLQHLTIGKQTIKQALTETMKEVGPDPSSKATLLAYPKEAWESTISSK